MALNIRVFSNAPAHFRRSTFTALSVATTMASKSESAQKLQALLVEATAAASGARTETAFKEKTRGEKPAGIKTKSRALRNPLTQ